VSVATQRELLASLDLVTTGDDVFVGSVPSAERESPWNLYGGHLLGQSLAAICRTVDATQFPHSLHAYFLRPADANAELEYQVTRTRDGRSFSHRHLTAHQADRPVFEMIASFQHPEEGRVYQQKMPDDVPDPDKVLGLPELVATLDKEPFDSFWTHRPRPVDLRYVNAHFTPTGPTENKGIRKWMRTFEPMPDHPHLHAAVLAYVADESISDNVLIPHDVQWGDEGLAVASLDHAMWFHQPFRVDDWLLIDQEPVATAGARGLSLGRVWDRAGRLVATMAQEAVIRLD
jgi:acyl-CoA thioesterase II